MKDRFVIGSRGSKLALTQAEAVKTQLSQLNPSFEFLIKVLKTSGDASSQPLSLIGGKGVFTKELEDALLDHRIDIAVHSLKDLPTILPDTLLIAAICKREDPRDALILRRDDITNQPSLKKLGLGAIVGTSSPRRVAQLKYVRADLQLKELRGNVDTRLRKLDEGQYDALILAAAGLRRLGLTERISASLDLAVMLPAVGQGALGVETRVEDSETVTAVRELNDEPTERACLAERAMLRALGGGCLLPIAAHAVVDEDRLRLEGLVAAMDGSEIIREHVTGQSDDAESLGAELGLQLLHQGALKLLGTL